MQKINKKGNVVMNTLVPGAIGITITAFLVGVTAKSLNDFSNGLAAGAAKDAVLNGTTGVGNLAAQLPIIGTIVGVGAILGVLLVAFAYFRAGK